MGKGASAGGPRAQPGAFRVFGYAAGTRKAVIRSLYPSGQDCVLRYRNCRCVILPLHVPKGPCMLSAAPV